MKILNLYACIGGNRKLWGDDHEITAVELDPKIAEIYQDYFPNDTVIVGDAHQYLLDHFHEFDFIWSSPPCPTHSDARRMGVHRGQNKAVYPDMDLYQEIILLKHFHKKGTLYCVENVKPYYDLLIPGQVRGRHIFWSNFYIHEFKGCSDQVGEMTISKGIEKTGIDLDDYNYTGRKDKVYRNHMNSRLGKHILDSATKNIQDKLF